MSKLIIVESPGKVKTIAKYVGSGYDVQSCYGHIRDLSKTNYGIDFSHGFAPVYVLNPDKKSVVANLRKAATAADEVLLATDDDREGEAISWHLQEVLKLKPASSKRIVFREITKQSIHHALAHPRQVDMDLVEAQQARRILDRLVGFDVSPVLWKKISYGLSAGRVQSVAVKLIVERERAIAAFVPIVNYSVQANFILPGGVELTSELSKRLPDYQQTRDFVKGCQGATYTIRDIEKKAGKKSPKAPFTTSTLQQEAYQKLGYSVKQTMVLAQQLYEAGEITYMRTDSVNLSQEALTAAGKVITSNYGAEYHQARTYSSKKGAQEAHEAIRPTRFDRKKAGREERAQRLYTLIWQRATASQMSDAKLARTTASIIPSSSNIGFLAKGEIVTFPGFLRAYGQGGGTQDKPLPTLNEGDTLLLGMMEASERFTKPSPRYSEATLVRELEAKGIGRPSTYVSIISTIQQRGYVVKESREGTKRPFRLITLNQEGVKETTSSATVGSEKNKLFPTDTAMVTTDFLITHFTDITDYGFTAKVEKQLDDIAHDKADWQKMLTTFYDNFSPQVARATEVDRESVNTRRLLGEDPKTGKPVYGRLSKYGPVVQLGEVSEEAEKPRFASLRKGQFIERLTLEEALDLLKLPREVGNFQGLPITAHIGRFSPYLKHGDKFYSLEKTQDPYTIGEQEAIQQIHAKREEEAKKFVKTFEEAPDIQILNGHWGCYIKYGKLNIKIPKEKDAAALTLTECREMITKASEKKKYARKKSQKK